MGPPAGRPTLLSPPPELPAVLGVRIPKIRRPVAAFAERFRERRLGRVTEPAGDLSKAAEIACDYDVRNERGRYNACRRGY